MGTQGAYTCKQILSLCHNLTSYPIFLVTEGERGKPRLEDECNRAVEKIQSLLTNEKLDIRETKGDRFLVRVSVLPMPKRKKKAMMIISATATWKLFELVECCAKYAM